MTLLFSARRLIAPTVLGAALSGCGVSPEYAEEPRMPEPPPADVDQAPAKQQTTRSRQSQTWQCAGSTSRTRQQGRLSRSQSIEGFTSRNCIAPATEVELNPNP
jgi:hypothetical protein